MEHGNHQISFADKSSYFSNAFVSMQTLNKAKHQHQFHGIKIYVGKKRR